MGLDEAVAGRRCLFKSCPRYCEGPGNGAFVFSAGDRASKLLPDFCPAGSRVVAVQATGRSRTPALVYVT